MNCLVKSNKFEEYCVNVGKLRGGLNHIRHIMQYDFKQITKYYPHDERLAEITSRILAAVEELDEFARDVNIEGKVLYKKSLPGLDRYDED